MKSRHIEANTDARIHVIIDHIQTNIYLPEKLRANVIAEKFGLSETYLGTLKGKAAKRSLCLSRGTSSV